MTCSLDPADSIDALYDRVLSYPGSVPAVAQRLRVAVKTLYNKLERSTTSHHLRHDEWERIQALLMAAKVENAFAPLQALCWRFDHVAVHVPALSDLDADISRDLMEVMSEVGDVARRAGEAVANDGKVSTKEWDGIELELVQAIAALARMRENGRAKFGGATQQKGDA